MSRENKLALIIGFTLILMVGVVVSDHLSRAREVDLDPVAEPVGDAAVEQRAFSGSLLREAIDATRQRAASSEPMAAVQIESGGGVLPAGTSVPAGDPVAASPTAGEVAREPAPVVIAQGPADGGIGRSLTELEQAADRVLGRLQTSATRPPMFELVRPGQGEAGGSGPMPSIPGPARGVVHEVGAGESLYQIAARYLGDGNRWREIQRANAGEIGEDGSVRVGQRVRIPGGQSTGAQAEGGGSSQPTGAAGRRTYVVKRGDALSRIAQRELGSSRRVDEIVRANAGLISDADDIRVGMELTIPPR